MSEKQLNNAPIPAYGDVMTVKEFAKAKLLAEGYGYWSDGRTLERSVKVRDTDAKPPVWATHVVWFRIGVEL